MPVLNWSIETFGWRFSYLAFGVFTFVGGLIAVLLIPPRRVDEVSGSGSAAVRELGPARGDFGLILRSPQFWIICGAFFLCLLGTPLHSSQMNMMLVGHGLTTQTAANVVSFYAASTIVGRLACGIALDRYPTPYVTAASMFLPAIGLFLLAMSLATLPVITFAMILVGIYVGAESDIMAYLVARYFKLRIYNSTLSLVTCCSFLASAAGAGGISVSLKLTDSFSPFMYVVSGTVFVGSLLFLLLPKQQDFEKIG
jgi:predicted MFS family arabinose efflux permease